MSGLSVTGFDKYIKCRAVTRGSDHTHTRIPDRTAGKPGGIYNIPEQDEETFLTTYYRHVFENRQQEHLTEKQHKTGGPLLVDVDLRYASTVTTRQHTSEHILDLVVLYAEQCSATHNIPNGAKLEVFVQEKAHVNKLPDKTKDGIHLIFATQMSKAAQLMLRDMVLKELPTIWDDIPIANDWTDVLDEGIARGSVNWQLYGSRKPGHEAYLVKNHYLLHYNDNEWTVEEVDMTQFDTRKMLPKLSARCRTHPKWELNNDAKLQLESYTSKCANKSRPRVLQKHTPQFVRFDKISNAEELDALIEQHLAGTSVDTYVLKETHDYTMCLPKQYYGKGSYNKWIRVGWALASTNAKLFLTWLKFSSQEGCRDTLCGSDKKFDWSKVGELYETWQGFDFDNPDALTHRSIMYWAKNDANEEYDRIHKNTINFFIEQTIKNKKHTEFDFAAVLHAIFKDRFVCVSIRNNCWYEYKNNRWVENDSGSALRLLISQDMHQLYVTKVLEHTSKYTLMEQSDEVSEEIRKRTNKLTDIAIVLKKTQWKNNIMREARELFYNKDFITKLDQNPYLLCFNNCVVDFKQKRHRKGQPDDYISKCTNIDYSKLNRKRDADTISRIETFMCELFPDESLREYMWQHLASCLVGTNENQTFNIYTGSGRNGKSKLVDLMSKGMGDYKGTVPITLITQKRNSIGSTSSEIVQLMGTRYAVMQEPSKGDRINEGIMKEITGGDPIQGRALFKDTVTFVPQFKLVVCTNTLFDIKSNDDGTWRRIRVCDFKSKFLEKPYEDDFKFPKEEYPYQFKVDKNLDAYFSDWAPVLMSMLVEISFKKQGDVTDCSMVMASSDQYREGQDYLAEFAKDNICKREGEKIKKTELLEHFRQWYSTNYGRRVPKGRELYEFMDKRYGKYRQGWHNISIIYDEEEVIDEC